MNLGLNHPVVLLAQARAGDREALGRLLELYRNYLLLVARTQLGGGMRRQVSHSDLVQETFLKAQADFGEFQGATEAEVVAWLRQILIRTLLDEIKRNQAAKRTWTRRESLDLLLERSSAVHKALATTLPSPSEQASRREQTVLLADALARLPDDHRHVILLRHVECLKFEEIAARMGRSLKAVQMLWARALEKLRSVF